MASTHFFYMNFNIIVGDSHHISFFGSYMLHIYPSHLHNSSLSQKLRTPK
uniref:Uncharacterized protein n=1 Tax=Solanum lycopersicum TaxID=4081 RepID=A0A3Q7GJ88_SOLLC